MNRHDRILVIDHQPYWRDFYSEALKAAGFSVSSNDTYITPQNGPEDPDLVVLGCSSVGPDEQHLISQVLTGRKHVLVLATFLPWQVMRSLFLQGVDDVVDKPSNTSYLVNIVRDALNNITAQDSAREKEGIR